MLGSRFDISEVIEGLSTHTDDGEVAACLELERELTKVAQAVHRASTVLRCPVCEEVMQVREERDIAEFGPLDVKLHRLECTTCGMLTGRVYHPSVGYHATLVR